MHRLIIEQLKLVDFLKCQKNVHTKIFRMILMTIEADQELKKGKKSFKFFREFKNAEKPDV